jgi:hypothetical protein
MRFRQFQDLLVHLRTFHAPSTEGLTHYHHWCASLDWDARFLAVQKQIAQGVHM